MPTDVLDRQVEASKRRGKDERGGRVQGRTHPILILSSFAQKRG